MRKNKTGVLTGVLLLTPIMLGVQNAYAEPVAGGTLDPESIPKYVTPLVIPPVMKNAGDCLLYTSDAADDDTIVGW